MHKGTEAPLTTSSPLNQPTEDTMEKRGAVMKGGFMKWNMVLSWLVFSAVGWMVPAATIIYKQLASLLAEEHVQSYHKTKSWSKCVPNNFLLRLSITCMLVPQLTVPTEWLPSVKANSTCGCKAGQNHKHKHVNYASLLPSAYTWLYMSCANF